MLLVVALEIVHQLLGHRGNNLIVHCLNEPQQLYCLICILLPLFGEVESFLEFLRVFVFELYGQSTNEFE